MNIPSVHYADDEEIDDYDEEEDLDVTSDLDPSPEDEVDPLTCSPDVGELKSTGVGDRKKVSLQLRFEGRQSLSMSHSCLLYTSPSPRDSAVSRMPSSA